eukprot:TRINITY_DN5436_c1_g2_i1.p1 TRINITY_DN5436_c1_g2~~TRINITY_DN5436_c1_g2_i1.p1  ORF type:complete len:1291 (-),score=264.41 TRINITY_DN5436_c1_g2_i1:29-3901(-)
MEPRTGTPGRGASDILKPWKSQLQEIFTYYASYNDPGNTDSINELNTYKLLRDCKVLSTSFTDLEADDLFARILGGRNASGSYEQFEHFLVEVAEQTLLPTSRSVSEAITRFMNAFILPYACRKGTDAVAEELCEHEIRSLFNRYRKALQVIFARYATRATVDERVTWSVASQENRTMSPGDMVRFCRDFEIVPRLIQLNAVTDIVKQSNFGVKPPTAHEHLLYPEWIEALGRIAMSIFSRYPFDGLQTSARDKCEALLQRMDMSAGMKAVRSECGPSLVVFDWQQAPNADTIVMKTQADARAAGVSSGRPFNSAGSGVSSGLLFVSSSESVKSVFEGPIALLQADFVDDLRRIFLYYCAYGSLATEVEHMPAQSFHKLVRDCGLLNNNFTMLECQATFEEAAVDNELPEEVRREQLLHTTGLDMPQFVRALTIMCRKRLVVPKSGMTMPEHLNDLVKMSILPRAGRAPADGTCDSLQTPAVIDLFQRYQRGLQVLFTVYSELGLKSRDVASITWQRIQETQATIKKHSWERFVADFEIAPSKMPVDEAHEMFTRSLPYGSTAADLVGLSYPEFLEAIGRCASAIFSRYPYENFGTDAASKVEALLQRLDMSAGMQIVRSQQTQHVSIFDWSAAPTTDMEADFGIVIDDATMQDLQRIFMHYVSLSASFNAHWLSALTFLRFCRECRLLDNRLTVMDADQIFASAAGKSPGLNLESFIVAIRKIAQKKFPMDPLVETMPRVLHGHVLCYGAVCASDPQANSLLENDVLQLIGRFSPSLQIIFTVYAARESSAIRFDSTWDVVMRANATLTKDVFSRLCGEFELAPHIVNQSDVANAFREANMSLRADDDPTTLNYSEFIEALGRIAICGYSRYPFNSVDMTTCEKMEMLLRRMDVSPGLLMIRRMFAIPISLFDWGASRKASTPTTPGKQIQQRVPELDEATTSQMQRIFIYYASYGEKTHFETLGMTGYMKLLRDCGLLDSRFTIVDADLVYVESTPDRKSMGYPEFLTALQRIAVHRYSSQPTAAMSMSLFLSRDIIPHASRQENDDEADELMRADVKALLRKYGKTLQEIYKFYTKKGRRMPTIAWEELLKQNECITQEEFVMFAKDFTITPSLLTTVDVMRIFRSTLAPANAVAARNLAYASAESGEADTAAPPSSPVKVPRTPTSVPRTPTTPVPTTPRSSSAVKRFGSSGSVSRSTSKESVTTPARRDTSVLQTRENMNVLNYSEFLEAMGRCALEGFSRPPFDSENLSASEKMMRLFKKMEFSRGMKRVIKETGYIPRTTLGF